jgi:R67 dihydrofolate reductase
MIEQDFPLGCAVRKASGPAWRGKVVGYYSSSFTPEGLVVECTAEGAKGQVHVEPAKRMERIPEPAASDITEGIPDVAVWAGIAAWDKALEDTANYVSGVTPDWDDGMICCAIYKAMAPLVGGLPELDSDCPFCGGLNLSCPEGCGRMEEVT